MRKRNLKRFCILFVGSNIGGKRTNAKGVFSFCVRSLLYNYDYLRLSRMLYTSFKLSASPVCSKFNAVSANAQYSSIFFCIVSRTQFCIFSVTFILRMSYRAVYIAKYSIPPLSEKCQTF